MIVPVGIGQQWSSEELDWTREKLLNKRFFAVEWNRGEKKTTVSLLADITVSFKLVESNSIYHLFML